MNNTSNIEQSNVQSNRTKIAQREKARRQKLIKKLEELPNTKVHISGLGFFLPDIVHADMKQESNIENFFKRVFSFIKKFITN